jgi:hypothetical protein
VVVVDVVEVDGSSLVVDFVSSVLGSVSVVVGSSSVLVVEEDVVVEALSSHCSPIWDPS